MLNKGLSGAASTAQTGNAKSGKVTKYSGDVSAAISHTHAGVDSIFRAVKADIGGELNIKTDAAAIASSNIAQGDFSISIANAAIVEVRSTSDGSFSANLESLSGQEGDAIRAGSINVNTAYTAKADAIGGAPTADVGLFSTKVNLAQAQTESKANSKVSGTGNIETGALNVVTNARDVNAMAQTKTSKFSVKLIKVAANLSEAMTNFDQSATVENNGTITVSDVFNVKSTVSSSLAKAIAGASGGGVEVTLVGADLNRAQADSAQTNTASITGSGIINTGSLNVLADGSGSKADAQVKDAFGISVTSIIKHSSAISVLLHPLPMYMPPLPLIHYSFFSSPVSSLNCRIRSSTLSASAFTLSQVCSVSYHRLCSSSEVLPCCSTQV